MTTVEFQERLNLIYGNQFIVLSDYINNETKIFLKCKKCGNIISKKPVKMTGVTKEGCYICSGKNHYKTKDSLQSEVDKKYPNTYKILDEYRGARNPISVMRLQCGHIYNISPDNILRGKGCPKCGIRQSHYMDIVEKYLLERNIEYVKEKRFSDCKNIRTLPFDYYIPKMNICIEVDGEFHYEHNGKPINKHNKYSDVLHRDKLKTEYCANKYIKLIRLPYFKEKHFYEILDKELYTNTEITL